MKRRLKQELGLEISEVTNILPDYKYRAEFQGVVEHEICPVFVAVTNKEPNPNPHEVEAIRFVPWQDFQAEVVNAAPPYSHWCIEETKLLNESSVFQDWYSKITS